MLHYKYIIESGVTYYMHIVYLQIMQNESLSCFAIIQNDYIHKLYYIHFLCASVAWIVGDNIVQSHGNRLCGHTQASHSHGRSCAMWILIAQTSTNLYLPLDQFTKDFFSQLKFDGKFTLV